jgi:uncharacterized protein
VHWFLSLTLFFTIYSLGSELEIPALNSPVMDEAGFLNGSEKEDLSQLAYEIFTHQGPQITIFTVDNLQGHSIEDFSIRVAEKWKLGTKKSGNGLLIVIARSERQMRIEVGEGIEGEITDYEANQYIRTILNPAFKQGDFYGGLKAVLIDISQKFNIQIKTDQKMLRRKAPQPNLPQGCHFLFIIGLIILTLAQVLFRKHSIARGFASGLSLASAGFFIGAFEIASIVILFLVGLIIGFVGLHNLLYQLASGSSHRRYGGGGGFGGGGWSGGGGGFSGGGSSGNW